MTSYVNLTTISLDARRRALYSPLAFVSLSEFDQLSCGSGRERRSYGHATCCADSAAPSLALGIWPSGLPPESPYPRLTPNFLFHFGTRPAPTASRLLLRRRRRSSQRPNRTAYR